MADKPPVLFIAGTEITPPGKKTQAEYDQLKRRVESALTAYKYARREFMVNWKKIPDKDKIRITKVQLLDNKKEVIFWFERESVSPPKGPIWENHHLNWSQWRGAFISWGFPETTVWNGAVESTRGPAFPLSGSGENAVGGLVLTTNGGTGSSYGVKFSLNQLSDGLGEKELKKLKDAVINPRIFGAEGEPTWRLANEMNKALRNLLEAKARLDKAWVEPPPAPPKPEDAPVVETIPTNLYAYNDTTLKYNLGAVNYAYFRDYGESPTGNSKDIGLQYTPGGNAPIHRIKNGREAFSGLHLVDSGKKNKKGEAIWEYKDNVTPYASKGIIQSMIKPKDIQANTSGNTNLSPEQAGKLGKALNPMRMGFQFHYNPSDLTISWQGSPNVDVGFVMSGQDKFGPVGAASGTGSGFTINIPINRLADQQFVGLPESQWGNINWEKIYGIGISEQDPKAKVSQTPTYDDLRKIRDLGTMYDVEYLLQTILGYQMKSGIRVGKHQMTADLGYLGGFPVEVHLGKNMRYYVSIQGISVYTKHFSKDMVPLISGLTIACSRLPDYSPSATTTVTTGA